MSRFRSPKHQYYSCVYTVSEKEGVLFVSRRVNPLYFFRRKPVLLLPVQEVSLAARSYSSKLSLSFSPGFKTARRK